MLFHKKDCKTGYYAPYFTTYFSRYWFFVNLGGIHI